MTQAKPTLREWLREGPFTLAMSSGFFGFFAHTGVLRALEDASLVPTKVTGSSSGALVAGTWATGVHASELEDVVLGLRREDFWDPAPGFGLLRGELFRDLIDATIRARRIEECRVPLAISVFDLRARRTDVLRSGPVNEAIRASCALPVLFQPVKIEGRTYVDGGVIDRPGVEGARGDARVLLHHLHSKSPWRAFYGPAQEPKPTPGQVVFSVPNIPRVNPFSLHVGRHALDAARNAMAEALERPAEVGA